MNPRILLIGGSGQVGWELARSLLPVGEVHAPPHASLDLGIAEHRAEWLDRLRPDVVVNAAAFTAVDRAEAEADDADRINGTAVGALADECRARNCLLVHYSTDFVFDGAKGAPYVEDDPPAPINAYGTSKLLGERLIVQSGCAYVLMRLSWIYSLRRSNFLKAIVARARHEDAIDVVDDQIGGPTPAWLVADVTAHLLTRWRATGADQDLRTLLHVGCTGSASRHEFAGAILSGLAARRARIEEFRIDRPPRLSRTSSVDFPNAARRPADSRLAVDRVIREWCLNLPAWRDALELTLREA